MAEKEVELGEEGAGKKGKKGLIWIVILLVLVFAGAGAAAAWFFLSGGGEEETGEEGPAERHYHGLEPMTVNIDGPGRIRYLRLELSVVTTDPEVIAALQRHMPAVRNDVLGLLGEKHYDDLNTRDGKESLAEELREAIAEILEERDAPHDVEAVRFNELVMQ